MSNIAKIETPVPAPVADGLVSMIERMALDPAISPERVEQAFRFYQTVQADTARRSYHAAFAQMQPELPSIERKGTAHNAKKYARYEDISDAIMPVLRKHGFGLSFRLEEAQGKVIVTCIISHKDGHSETTTHPFPYDATGNKNAIQAIGSATSYGKRYTLSALLGLATRDEDDDGNAAGAGELISEDQFNELAALIRDTKTDLQKFLALGNLQGLSDMPARDFERAKGLLLKKKKASAP